MAGDPVMVTSFLATWVKERALLPWERTPGLGKGSADAQKGGEHPVGTALGGWHQPSQRGGFAEEGTSWF